MSKNKDEQRRRREQRARVAMHQRPARRGSRPLWLAIGGLVVVAAVTAGMVAAYAARSPAADTGHARNDAPPAVVRDAATVPLGAFDAIGAGGGAVSTPSRVDGAPLRINGKPGVVYVGAEYCPYCAAERWAVVAALSRFGRFSGLGATHSASADVYPDTPTFSFHGASYASPYLTFQGFETHSNRRQGSSYAPLDAPSPLAADLVGRYDGASGSIPFIDIGNRYIVSGASYDPSVLSGLSMSQIASEMRDPQSPVARSVLGTANDLSAAVCSITGNRPADVCSSSGVLAAGRRLAGG
jgi:uncharacterized protein DUF929